MKSKIYQQLNYWLGVIALGIVLGLSIQYVSAWTNPSSTAPNGNVGAPLNTGSSDQSKSGGGIAVYGNTYGLYGSGSSYGILGQDSTSGEGSHAYLGYGGYGSVSVGSSIGAYGQGPNHGVQGYNSSYGSGGILGYYNQGVYGYGSAYGVNGYNTSYGSQGLLGYYNTGVYASGGYAGVQGYNSSYGSQGLLGYYDVGGYFSGTTGVYAQNSWGYYAYLGYPSSSWGVYSNGAIGGTIYYDSNNTGYYVDPNYVSNMAYVYAQWIADSNNTNYYIDPNGTSVLNVVYSNNYIQAPIYYDDDSNYYMNANWISRMRYIYADGIHSYGTIGASSYMQAQRYYDDNSYYYIDSNTTSVMNSIYSNNYIQAPIYYDDDSNYYVNSNSNSRMYAVYVDGLHSYGSVGASGNGYSTYLNNGSYGLWTQGYAYVGGHVNSPMYYDNNDTNYYMDPNGTSVLNTVKIWGSLYIGSGQDFSIRLNNSDEFFALNAIDGYSVLVPGDSGFRVTNKGNNANNMILTDNGLLYVRSGMYGNQSWMSDSRVKFNQEPLKYGLADLLKLEPKKYFKAETDLNKPEDDIKIYPDRGKEEIGFVAQEVYDIIPEIVTKPKNENKEFWGLDYGKFSAVIVKAIQELKWEKDWDVQELKSENQQLKEVLCKHHPEEEICR